MKKFLELVGIALVVLTVGGLVLFFLYTLFVYTPVSLWAQAKCLRNGYPKSSVSVGLESYCMNLDGSVTVRVDKASEQKK